MSHCLIICKNSWWEFWFDFSIERKCLKYIFEIALILIFSLFLELYYKSLIFATTSFCSLIYLLFIHLSSSYFGPGIVLLLPAYLNNFFLSIPHLQIVKSSNSLFHPSAISILCVPFSMKGFIMLRELDHFKG